MKRDIDNLSRDKERFLSAVYYHYDYRLIIASSLALAGYINHVAVQQVLHDRIEAIYSVVQHGNFNIYEEPGKFSVHPKEWTNQQLKWELYLDGNIKLPFVHDIFAFSSIYKHSRQELRRKIDAIVELVLSPEHQRFHYNFGYIRCPDGRGRRLVSGWTSRVILVMKVLTSIHGRLCCAADKWPISPQPGNIPGFR